MYAGKACAHCRPEGCAIYETRPEEPCRAFKCAWLLDEEAFPADMRPDRCGAIVLSARHWKEWNVMRAVPIGPVIPEATLEWLRLHTQSKEVPLIFYERGFADGAYTHTERQRAFGSPEFSAAINEAILRLGDTEETLFTADDVVKFG
jgi:hypothetical protein